MENLKNMENRLWDFIDGLSTPDERNEILRLLETNPSWQQAYAAMMDMNMILQETSLEEPSMRFSKNVMEEISLLKVAPATKNYVNKKIVYSIGGFFIILIIGFLGYMFTQIDLSQPGSSPSPVDFSSFEFDWRKYYKPAYINIFLMVDVVLGLLYLDNYLRRKKNQQQASKG